MTLSLILLALSITGSLLTYFLTGIYQDIAFLWLPFVLIIAYFVGLLIAQSFITFFIALFVNVKKEQKKPNPFFNFEIRNISQVFLKMCLIKVHVKGKELLPEKKKNNAFVAAAYTLFILANIGGVVYFEGDEVLSASCGDDLVDIKVAVCEDILVFKVQILHKMHCAVDDGTCNENC